MVKVFNEMNTSGVEPNEITANILINGYGRAHDLQKCVEVFEAFQQKFGKLTAVSYNMIIEAFLVNQQPQNAFKWLEQMRKDDVQPLSHFGWQTASSAIVRMSNLEKSFENVQQNPTVLDSVQELVVQCVECNRPDLAQHTNQMIQQSNTLKWADIEAKLSESGRAVVQEWVDAGVFNREGLELKKQGRGRPGENRGGRRDRYGRNQGRPGYRRDAGAGYGTSASAGSIATNAAGETIVLETVAAAGGAETESPVGTDPLSAGTESLSAGTDSFSAGTDSSSSFSTGSDFSSSSSATSY